VTFWGLSCCPDGWMLQRHHSFAELSTPSGTRPSLDTQLGAALAHCHPHPHTPHTITRLESGMEGEGLSGGHTHRQHKVSAVAGGGSTDKVSGDSMKDADRDFTRSAHMPKWTTMKPLPHLPGDIHPFPTTAKLSQPCIPRAFLSTTSTTTDTVPPTITTNHVHATTSTASLHRASNLHCDRRPDRP
jgi:hypothetical protein